jgi:hypothetical protein
MHILEKGKDTAAMSDKNIIISSIPFVFITFVIPVIIWHIRVVHNEEMGMVLLKTTWYDDYFHLIKAIFLLFAALLMLIIYLFKRDMDTVFPKIFLLPVFYFACVLLSAYNSEYRISAFFGIIDHYEGCLTQFCYMLVLIFSYFLIRDFRQYIAISKFMLTASLIVAFVGILQFTGVNATEPAYMVSSTIGNSNYVGTYSVLLLPSAMSMVFYESDFAKRACYLLLFIGSALFLLFGSMSGAAFAAAFMTAVVFTVFMRKEIKKRYKWYFALVMYGIMIFLLMNSYSKGLLLEELKKTNPFYNKNTDKIHFKDVSLFGDSATIRTNKWTLNIKNDNSGFTFSNELGYPVAIQKDHELQKLYFKTAPYSGITGHLRENEQFQWLMLNIEGKDIEFVKYEGKLQVVGYNGLVTDIEYPETLGFKGRESFASGRGYIWSRALPLLKKAVFLGFGPDTFTYIFPQNDIAGKLNYGAIWVIISKPHNWYLQIALGSGILSLAFLICFIVWFIVNSLKFLHRASKGGDEERREMIIICAILSAVIGYLITGVFNDSVVAVSPIFWMTLGFGTRMLVNAGANVEIKYNGGL